MLLIGVKNFKGIDDPRWMTEYEPGWWAGHQLPILSSQKMAAHPMTYAAITGQPALARFADDVIVHSGSVIGCVVEDVGVEHLPKHAQVIGRPLSSSDILFGKSLWRAATATLTNQPGRILKLQSTFGKERDQLRLAVDYARHERHGHITSQLSYSQFQDAQSTLAWAGLQVDTADLVAIVCAEV